ncbi:hypothetical protein GOV12_06305 [Candidatus Pacearchaeota archaeon]|nr:hypothetical protein [Candidatus Pacearchaeota archaeon]
MVRRKNKTEKLEDSVMEVSFSPGKPVSLVLGEKVPVNMGDKVLINGIEEYVLSVNRGVLETLGYEGKAILHRRRPLNDGAIHRFDLTLHTDRYLPNNPGDRKNYLKSKQVLEIQEIYPN